MNLGERPHAVWIGIIPFAAGTVAGLIAGAAVAMWRLDAVERAAASTDSRLSATLDRIDGRFSRMDERIDSVQINSPHDAKLRLEKIETALGEAPNERIKRGEHADESIKWLDRRIDDLERVCGRSGK